jgi:methylenetetrahydrofolate--tRNA-(uracil-5-)-methyltransferase
MTPRVAVVGAGLAGSEAAWQLARRAIPVELFEMRPGRQTQAHRGEGCAELVCSNSFKSTALENAHGLLKAEMNLQGALVLQCARASAVPAGQALAVDRELFSRAVTERLASHPLIRIVREEVTSLDSLLARYALVIVATGPLTSDALSKDLAEQFGSRHLAFYDAISPVVMADSIDRSVAFAASRYGKGELDYLNCPLGEAEYRAFVEAVAGAEKVPLHPFESLRPFEGCLPIEVMAERGPLTLAHGPMKPVGLIDPRTGRRPFAVVQLRQENRQATMYSLVGFQTKMTWPEQRRIFRTVPGLERAEFARLGSLHRNTFIEAPRLLDADLAWREEPRVIFAGQITGVEGYMESAATGLYAGKRAAFRLMGREIPRLSPATMTGGLVRYVTEAPLAEFQPMNASFGLLDPAPPHLTKPDKRAFLVRRALSEMERLERMESGAERSSLGARQAHDENRDNAGAILYR